MGLQEEANAAGERAEAGYRANPVKKNLRWKAGEKCGMYCPQCGSPLLYSADRPEHDHQSAIELSCTGECFSGEDGFPLVYHHPIRGMDKAPGDSWSLTWLK